MKEGFHITVIGTGKVALQIGMQLRKAGHTIDNIWGRNEENAKNLASKLAVTTIDNLSDIKENSLALICVSDTAINNVLQNIPSSIKVAYTSGSIRIKDLKSREYLGVFYPLQTFSPTRTINISEVPFLIEASNKEFENELFTLASTLSESVVLANSEDRYNTHIAAVMVNNFTNFLFHLAKKQLDSKNLDFSILKPLIKETVAKLEDLTPIQAQTGPAARGDKKVIENHIATIADPKTKELYRLMSELIYKEINNNEL